MREESHTKGSQYQRAVKTWLNGWKLFQKPLHALGDAYDATRHAAKVGTQYYDLSLKLGEADHAEHVLYIECKYRRRPGLLKGELGSALLKAYAALGEVDAGQRDETKFCFVASVPPESWTSYLSDPRDHIVKLLGKQGIEVDDVRVRHLIDNFHVLVATPPILGMN